MSRRTRTSIARAVTVAADGGTAPGDYKPEIAVELRVLFPPKADRAVVARAVLGAVSEVLEELHDDGGWLVLAPLGVWPAVA